ncbi:hypothetical protein FOCC_FOCC002685, partial [Frankliniella occidentalis]
MARRGRGGRGRSARPRPAMDHRDDDSGLGAVQDADDADLLLGAVRDHHDYAKRRRSGSDRENNVVSELDELSLPVPKKSKAVAGSKGLGKGRQLRDPEGGTYISARSRARKSPLPMKLRALPASFWEQPNLNKGPSPGTIFSALPPLGPLCKEDGADGPRDALRGANPAR